MKRYIVEWEADGEFSVEAEGYDDAMDAAYDYVRDYLDRNALEGDFSINIPTENGGES